VTPELDRQDVERLVRIETKLDEALSRLSEDRRSHDEAMAQLRVEHDKDVQEVSDDVEKLAVRVGSLENWRYAIAAALMMGAGGTIASVVNAVPK